MIIVVTGYVKRGRDGELYMDKKKLANHFDLDINKCITFDEATAEQRNNLPQIGITYEGEDFRR